MIVLEYINLRHKSNTVNAKKNESNRNEKGNETG